MTGRDLVKDRSLKPVKIAESDIDVSEQGNRLTTPPAPTHHPRLAASPQNGGRQLQAGLRGSVAKDFLITLQDHALFSSPQVLSNLFLFTGQTEHLL